MLFKNGQALSLSYGSPFLFHYMKNNKGLTKPQNFLHLAKIYKKYWTWCSCLCCSTVSWLYSIHALGCDPSLDSAQICSAPKHRSWHSPPESVGPYSEQKSTKVFSKSPFSVTEAGRWEGTSGDQLVQPSVQNIHRWIRLLGASF